MSRKYDGLGQVDNKKLRDTIDILEIGMGECEKVIPSTVLQDAIDYLELLSYLCGWYGCSEDMGR